MKKGVLILIVLLGSFITSFGQKSKVIAVFQLIESSKYKDAKAAIEDAIEEESTKHWYRTWYARGLLAQQAYRDGIKKNDKNKYELYPDQLYVAYESYEKALKLDTKGRINDQLEPHYVLLANDFQNQGEKKYKNNKFKEALRAFETALSINQNPILSVKLDSNLVYNTALAAVESGEWETAIDYLKMLNENKYSPNIPHLLYSVYIEKEDTSSAERVLYEGMKKYEDNQQLILQLIDLLNNKNEIEAAVSILDSASMADTSNYIYPYTKGLVYQKNHQYEDAIESYKEALSRDPGNEEVILHIGTSYYNIGVDIEQRARGIRNNKLFIQEKEKSRKALQSSVKWFERALEKRPEDQELITKLYQLYKYLGITDKLKSLEAQMN